LAACQSYSSTGNMLACLLFFAPRTTWQRQSDQSLSVSQPSTHSGSACQAVLLQPQRGLGDSAPIKSLSCWVQSQQENVGPQLTAVQCMRALLDHGHTALPSHCDGHSCGSHVRGLDALISLEVTSCNPGARVPWHAHHHHQITKLSHSINAIGHGMLEAFLAGCCCLIYMGSQSSVSLTMNLTLSLNSSTEYYKQRC
jgi:hypothetical protein